MTLTPTPLKPSRVFIAPESAENQQALYLPDYAALLADPPGVAVTLLNTQGLPTKRVQFNNQSIEEFQYFWTVPAPPKLRQQDGWKGFTAMDCSDGQIYCVGENHLYHLEVEGGLDKGTVDTMTWQEVSIPDVLVSAAVAEEDCIQREVSLSLLPPVSDGAYLYLVDSSAGIHKVFKPTGEIVWSKPGSPLMCLLPGQQSAAALDPTSGLLYYLRLEGLTAQNLSSGFAVTGGHLYLCAANLSDGELAWKTLFPDLGPAPRYGARYLVASGSSVAMVPASEYNESPFLISGEQVLPASGLPSGLSPGELYPFGTTGSFAYATSGGASIEVGVAVSQGGKVQVSKSKFCYSKSGELQPAHSFGGWVSLSSTSGQEEADGFLVSFTPAAGDPAGETFFLTFSTYTADKLSENPSWITKVRLIPTGSELKLEVLEAYALANVQVCGPPAIGPQGEMYETVIPSLNGVQVQGEIFLVAYQP